MPNLMKAVKDIEKAAKERKEKYNQEKYKLEDKLQQGVDYAGEKFGDTGRKIGSGIASAVSTTHEMFRDPGDEITPEGMGGVGKLGKKAIEVLDSPDLWKKFTQKTAMEKAGGGVRKTPEAKMKWLREVESWVKDYKVPENLPIGKIDEEVATVTRMLEAEKRALKGSK